MKTYTVKDDYSASSNTIVDVIDISSFVDTAKYSVKKAWINVGGWQSWNPGFEVEPGKKQDSLTCHLIKGWNKYLVFPETEFTPSKNIVLGQFVTYLRWDDFYLVFASVGNVDSTLPPVQFVINRKNDTISVELYDKGAQWKKNELQAKIEIFTANSYFECKNRLKKLFDCGQFDSITHLGKNPVGWESWYNHYADINEKLILENLSALSSSKNVISEGEYSSKIFQIDDGWEKALGEWQVRTDRFPNGLKPLVDKIEAEGFIPGLWIAPFIIDSRCETATEHPDWILCDDQGDKIVSGYNPLWGDKGNFYCLDLSNEEVIAHLDSVMERAINQWGFRYLKLDFLYAGMFYGDFKNRTSAYKSYNHAVEVLTRRKESKNGKKVSYLGCGVPFESSFKYFPLSRIGCDTLEHWKNKKLRLINWNGRNEAYLNIKDTLGHALWNNTIFANDPDVVFVRENNCSLTDDEKLLISSVNILFGSQFMYSDDPCEKSTEKELQLTEKVLKMIKRYKNEEFGLKQIRKDEYEIFNESGTIKGLLKIGKEHSIRFEK